MNYQKGMSQTLALIVAASVLMMTALTVIFLTNNTITGVGQDTSQSKCVNTIRGQCGSTSSTTIPTPSVCYHQNSDGESVPNDNWITSAGKTRNDDDTINCR